MDADAANQCIRFSTDLIPRRERLAYLREAFGRSIARLELEPIGGRQLKWAASMNGFDEISVIRGQTSAARCRRTSALLADGNDDFLFTTNLAGFSLPYQVGRESQMQAGAAVLLSSSDTGGQDFPGPSKFLTLRIPRRRLIGMTVKAEDALARPIPASTEALRLLVDYVEGTLGERRLTSPRLRQLSAAYVLDLVALAVGATRDAQEQARDRGLRAARLGAIKDDIAKHLGDEALSVSSVARRRGVTPRYVQLLFETEGTTFTDYVLGERLARAYRLLAGGDPGIGSIAFEVGFGNLSYFNRSFRRRFGETPSDVRRRIGQGGSAAR